VCVDACLCKLQPSGHTAGSGAAGVCTWVQLCKIACTLILQACFLAPLWSLSFRLHFSRPPLSAQSTHDAPHPLQSVYLLQVTPFKPHMHAHIQTLTHTHARTHARTHTHTHIYKHSHTGGAGGTALFASSGAFGSMDGSMDGQDPYLLLVMEAVLPPLRAACIMWEPRDPEVGVSRSRSSV
jgi:hypothetical protein